MIRRAVISLIFISAIGATVCSAYDAETHGLITYRAYYKSALWRLGQGSIVQSLGLDANRGQV